MMISTNPGARTLLGAAVLAWLGLTGCASDADPVDGVNPSATDLNPVLSDGVDAGPDDPRPLGADTPATSPSAEDQGSIREVAIPEAADGRTLRDMPACIAPNLALLKTACTLAAAGTTPITARPIGHPSPRTIQVGTVYGIRLPEVGGMGEGVVEVVPPHTGSYSIFLGTPYLPVAVRHNGQPLEATCGIRMGTSQVGECSLKGAQRFTLTGGEHYRIELGRAATQRWVRLLVSAEDPAPTRLVFAARSPSTGTRDLFTVLSDGTDLRQVTSTPEDELYPSLAPDGTAIAFIRNNQLVVTDIAGLTAQVVAPVVGRPPIYPSFHHQSAAAWSPDSLRLVYPAPRAPFIIETDDETVDESYATELHVVSRNGLGDRKIREDDGGLPPGYGSLTHPTWSANGLIAFVSGDDCPDCAGGTWLALIREDGSGLTEVPGVYGVVAPDWSPSATSLVVAGGRLNIPYTTAGSLTVISMDGAQRTLPVRGSTPRWSPNGDEIAYATSDGIYVIEAQGLRQPRRVVEAASLAGLDW